MTNIIQTLRSAYYEPATVSVVPVGSATPIENLEVRTSRIVRRTYSDPFTNYSVTLPWGATLENLTPSVYSYANGVAEKLTSAIGRAKIISPLCNEFLNLDFRSGSSYSVEKIAGYTTGSWGDAADDVLVALLDADKDAAYYNGTTYTECAAQPGGIQRNANCWAADLDFSGVPVTYLFGGFFGGGALVTRRHLVCCHHYVPGNKVGNTIRFVANDGEVIERTILAQTSGSTNPGNFNPSYPVGDLCVFLLSSDLPETVVSYPVIGDWFPLVDNTQTIGGTRYDDVTVDCAFVTTNQSREIRFTRCAVKYLNQASSVDKSASINGNAFTQPDAFYAPFQSELASDDFSDFESAAITGDSGSPVFMPLAGNSMALYTLTTYPKNGTRANASKLNAMILDVDGQAGVSTGYTVTVATDPTA